MTTLANRLRAIASEMRERDLAALVSGIAIDVGRMEAALDELAGNASDDARAVGLRPVGEAVERIVERARR